MLGQGLVEEDLLVGRNYGVDFVNRHAVGVLSVDDADKACGVLMQVDIVRAVHDTFGIEIAQTVGNDAQIVVFETGDAIGVVLIELSDLLA